MDKDKLYARYIGRVYGKLTIVSFAYWRKGAYYYMVRCTCGDERAVAIGNLVNGGLSACRSCAQKTHGLHAHPLYQTWKSMKKRCYNANFARYSDYGGRGIRVCERWYDSFPNFLADMGERPPGRTLDRVDNDGDYSPSNCRWATPAQQAANRRPHNRKDIAILLGLEV